MAVKTFGLVGTAEGVDLVLTHDDGTIQPISLPLMGAVHVWHDWWKLLGNHYPKKRPGGPTELEGDNGPSMMEFGNVSYSSSARSDGNVYWWIRPEDCAGISYFLAPAEARAMAAQLLEHAEAAEQFLKPHN